MAKLIGQSSTADTAVLGTNNCSPPGENGGWLESAQGEDVRRHSKNDIVNLVGPCGAWKDRLVARGGEGWTGGGRCGVVAGVPLSDGDHQSLRKTHYLWRAVDQHGNVLDILVTSRRDANTATRFFRKLLPGLEYVPQVVVTD